MQNATIKKGSVKDFVIAEKQLRKLHLKKQKKWVADLVKCVITNKTLNIMTFIAYLLGFLVHWIVYIIAFNVFGESGFMFYLGTFLSSAIGGYLGAIVTGKAVYKKNGTQMNLFIPLLFGLTVLGGLIGVIMDGFGEIWEYIVALAGLFIAFGFFNMYLDKSEKH